jgi:dolichol-phosphate mannosyltransferase
MFSGKSRSSSDGAMAGPRKKVVIMIPTYNEAGTIEPLIQEILDLRLAYDLCVLVVDDDSPDGTGDLVGRLASRDGRVRLLSRKGGRGRGSAGIEGFKTALSLKPDYIMEMDGDGSHQPRFIPALLRRAGKDDLVLGSRFVRGGQDADRPFHRRLITWLVRNFLRRLFHLPVSDVSSGFRCFRREILEKIGLDSLVSTGPSIVLETLCRAYLLGFRIAEVPIVFVDRKKGRTKLTPGILLKTLLLTFKIKRRFQASRLKAAS